MYPIEEFFQKLSFVQEIF